MLILTSLLLRETTDSRSLLWKYMATLKKLNEVLLRLAETV